MLSIALAIASVAIYMPAPELFALGTAASLVVGIGAVVRARRGAGSLVMAILGVVIGGTLTLLWTAWIVGLMLNPGALG